MDEDIIYVLVEQLASLLEWRDRAQNTAFEKSRFEYESELMNKIRELNKSN